MKGWLTVTGWQGLVASGGYLTGTIIQSLIVLTVLSYAASETSWQDTLLYWAAIFLAGFINTVVSSLLPKLKGLILVLHILGFFSILIPLVILAPHDSAKDVTGWLNEGNWSSQGLSFFVGLIGNFFAFLGADGAFHMSEEIRNPSLVVPRSIILSIILNGSMGLAMIIPILFCLGDIDAALSTNTGYPFIEIFFHATRSVSGSTTMASLVVYALLLTVSLRHPVCFGRLLEIMVYLAGELFQRWVCKSPYTLDPTNCSWTTTNLTLTRRTTIPLWSIAITCVVSCLLALINIGSATDFNDVVSLSVAGLYSSYLICALLLLYRRLTGRFQKLTDISDGPTLVNTTGAQLVWGPWHVPGVFGTINSTFASLYLTTILFFSFWPFTSPVTAANMNYSSLVTGAVMIFSVIYYIILGRHEWNGPVIEIHL
ncbi:uncharacterized protein EAF01_004208 [Botrytis porri]|uniref:uncharacterized protein n=1 Tax=Botrytis porri TaxID=87229 RepID=UPI001901CA5E|nr:uncharacterized protein EAF01_004208 [Botrytis porri]KAF7908453.1 hypothetical protein EAF01_004208 [Botrytis porri]